MKKILILFICLMLSVLFAGCNSANNEPSFAARKAWQIVESSKYSRENISFEAKRFRYEGTAKTAIATGNLSFRLKEDGQGITELATALELLHNEKSHNAGKTDTIDSLVSFDSDDLSPVHSQKSLLLASAIPQKGYSTETDYNAKNTSITPLDGSKKDYRLKSGNYYDNEMLYHLIRSIPGLTVGKSYSFSVLTPFDIYANDKYFVHDINISVDSTLSSLEVPKTIYDIAIPRDGDKTGKLNDDGVYKIDCLAVKISLDAEKSGPSIYIYLSDLNFIDQPLIKDNPALPNAYTFRVPIKIIASEYDMNTTQTYTNEYTITSYSTLI